MHKLRPFVGGTGERKGRNGISARIARIVLRDEAAVARKLVGKVRSFRYGCQ
jgi:hypothetical protein